MVEICALATAEHRTNPRSFAHVFHWKALEAEVVCVASQYFDLPIQFMAGVFLHEMGHLALKDRKHSEEQADRKAERMSGVKIYRRKYGRAENLECVRLRDIERARAFILLKMSE